MTNERNRERTHAVGTMQGYYTAPIQWKRTFVDHRASLSRAYDRPDAPLCPECKCELDVSPIPHSPRCSVDHVEPKPKSGTHKLASEGAKARKRAKRAKARA